jgi:hypothetical protein
MSYTTPPTLDPTLQKDLNSLVAVFAANHKVIAKTILQAGIASAGLKTPKISLENLIQLIDTVIIPTTHKWEGGWSDHPSDSGGATMRGVILTTFRGLFDSMFINTAIPAVATAAQNWNKKYPNWKKDNELGKKMLYVVAGNPSVGGLFIYKFLASGSNRYPIAIMSEDPFLGFFLSECCWGSGAGVYSSSRADFDGLARKYGWDGSHAKWASFINGLGDKTVEFATQAILYRYNHLMRISKPGTKNNVFRKGWLNRLLNAVDSNIMMLVKINENFNTNSSNQYKLSPSELAHLKRKADGYKQLNIELPG